MTVNPSAPLVIPANYLVYTYDDQAQPVNTQASYLSFVCIRNPSFREPRVQKQWPNKPLFRWDITTASHLVSSIREWYGYSCPLARYPWLFAPLHAAVSQMQYTELVINGRNKSICPSIFRALEEDDMIDAYINVFLARVYIYEMDMHQT